MNDPVELQGPACTIELYFDPQVSPDDAEEVAQDICDFLMRKYPRLIVDAQPGETT